MREPLLTETLAGRIGSQNFDQSGAELMILYYLDLAVTLQRSGADALANWLTKPNRPEKVVQALEGVVAKRSPVVTYSRFAIALKNSDLRGKELFEEIIACEGASLIGEGASPFYLFEYLASLFGEDQYPFLKEKIRKLHKTMKN